jgi:hypothetical protein
MVLFYFLPEIRAQFISYQRVDVPDTIVEMCNALFLEELGEEMFLECLVFDSAIAICKTYPNFQKRLDYKLHYTFTFPGVKEATFPLQMNYSLYLGELHVQSSRFMRRDKTDLPSDLYKMGTTIINYQKAQHIAHKTMPEMKNPTGYFVLGKDNFYWHFSEYTEIHDSTTRIETYFEKHVLVDLYSGDIILSYTK